MPETSVGDRLELSLLVLSDEPHFFDGRHYRCPYQFDRFVSAIGSHLKRVTIATPVRKTGEPFGQLVDLPHIAFRELPYWTSLASYLRLPYAERRRVRAAAAELVAAHDAVLVRLPSLAAEVFVRQARRQGKVLCTFLAGNILEAATPLHSRRWAVRLAARLLARWIHSRLMRMVRLADVPLAIGQELQGLSLAHNPQSRLFMETLVSEKDAYERNDDYSSDRPIRLLCVSRIAPGKGLDYLLAALAILTRRGIRARLRVAGGTTRQEYLEELRRQAAAEGVGDLVEWLGHVPFGQPLYQLYRESDVGVLPSLSEGFPRFINEAWAFSVPVVCTRLPGLSPPVVDGQNAVLVDLRSASSLADGIQRAIEDRELRRRLITNGLRLFREHSLERQSRRVAEYLAAARANAGNNAFRATSNAETKR